MGKDENPHWYTIREAAAYLQVGEPTIYRWMRDGRITYRKVGDSTRFLRDDLDGMVQVHRRREDIETVREHCPLCGGTELVSGRMQSTGLMYFRPEKTKFWTFREGNIKTQARMCADCGGISLFGDVDKLEKLQPTGPDENQ
jgi:excisionase family DNA binding protein